MHVTSKTALRTLTAVTWLLLATQSQAIVVTAHPIVIARPVIVARPAPVTAKVATPKPAAGAAAKTEPFHGVPMVVPVPVATAPHKNTSSNCDDSQKKNKNNACSR